MKNKQLQKGSAHSLIVIVLSLIIIGLLGFVFWQNFMQKKEITNSQSKQIATQNTSTNNKTVIDKEITLDKIAADNTVGTNLSIKYPSTWSIKNTNQDDNGGLMSEQYEITSPNGDIIIHYQIGNGGIGGTCEKTNGDELIKIEAEEIPNYPSARFVTYYGANYYYAGMQANNDRTKSVKTGDSMCDMGLSGVLAPIKNSKSIENVALILDLEFPNITSNSKESVEQFKQITTTENYKTAKRIIESLYVKE